MREQYLDLYQRLGRIEALLQHLVDLQKKPCAPQP
jgi:hypothetical protein